MRLQFLGATQTVTGSKYLLSVGSRQILVDCGLFQGFKHLRLKNWGQLPLDMNKLDCVILTHAHLDHSGLIPLLVKNGFSGKIYASEATRDLCGILLPDSGHLQEEEARYANKHGFSKHSPALPLYTHSEAIHSLRYFSVIDFQRDIDLGNGYKFRLTSAGHLLGASSVRFYNAKTSLVFSGDLGRTDDPLLRAPENRPEGDDLVLESTYGDRNHPKINPTDELGDIINSTLKQSGVVLVPSFAAGRAQAVLFHILKLKREKRIADVPVYLNSPMAKRVNEVFCKHSGALLIEADEAQEVCRVAETVDSVEESIALNRRKGPMILIAASGMAAGGRVLHHIKAFGADPRNTILFVGFQAGGTRGEAMVHGAQQVKIHGEYWPIKARVLNIDSMSAHADCQGLLAWARSAKSPPKRIFVTHGEPAAADFLRIKLSEQFKKTDVIVPEYRQSFEL